MFLLNSYYHKLSENVWVWGCGATRSEIWSDVTIAGQTNEQTKGKIGLLSQWTMEGWDEQLNVWGGRSFGLGCQTFSVSLSHSVMCQSKSTKNINLNKVKSTNIKGRFFTWGSHRPVLKMILFHVIINMDCIERPTWHRSSKPHWWSPLASPTPQHTRGLNQWPNRIYLFPSDLT